jgi:hypothetical protein
VHGEQVLDVADLEPDPSGLHAADLGPRCPDFVPGPLRGDALGLAQAAQLRAERHAQDGRLGRDVIRVGARLRADRHASFHHRSEVERPDRGATAAGQAG